MWRHEHKNWPNFTWDAEKLASNLADIRYHQGRLFCRMEGLGFELKQEASLRTLTNEVVKSSAQERFQLLIRKLATQFDGKIYGLNLPKTAIDFNPHNLPDGFTQDKYFYAELENMAVAG